MEVNTYHTEAYALEKQELYSQGEKPVVSSTLMDLRPYSGCPYLMGGIKYNTYDCWLDYNKTGKSDMFFPKGKIKRLGYSHQRYLNGLPYSLATLFYLIWGLAMSWFWAGGFIYLLIMLDAWFSFTNKTFLQVLQEGCFFEIFGSSYLIGQIGRFGMMYADDSYGYTFDRPSGQVLFIDKHGEIKKSYAFKDFIPLCMQDFTPAGAVKYTTGLLHKETGLTICIEHESVTRGVLAWNYLLQFMDVTQPIPDLPMQEQTRHLDPTTLAYDKKTNRDPYYWRKMDREQMKALENEAYKKAEAWIEQRSQELNYNLDKDYRWLNNLTRRHLKSCDTEVTV